LPFWESSLTSTHCSSSTGASATIVVLGLLFIPIFLVVRRYRPAHQGTVILAFLAVVSHLVLDLGGGTPVLWPLYPYDLSFKFSLNIMVGNGLGLSPHLQVTQTPVDFSRLPGLDYPLFTEEGLLLTLVLLIPIFYNILKRNQWGTRRETGVSNEQATQSTR
jgi:hypothetical protein